MTITDDDLRRLAGLGFKTYPHVSQLAAEVLELRAALDGLANVVFAAGLTADNTPAWLKSRAALASPDTGPLAHCTCDGNGPDGTGHLPDCGYWRAKEPT